MNLPQGFQFSQGILQDYVDCRRRFYLRYAVGLAWPAVESEPALENERFMRQGALFHHMVHQHILGVPSERLASLAHDDDLSRWWGNYVQYATKLLDQPQESAPSAGRAGLYPEISLSAALGGYRLLAKYDLVYRAAAGELVIIDWKTSRKRPKRQRLAERLQTRVYPYLLACAGAQFNQVSPGAPGNAPSPETIQMLYWFADFPEQPERFAYSAEQFNQDEAYLSGLLAEIRRLQEDQFEITSREERCAYCVYRSLCERGVQAGSMADETLEASENEAEAVTLDFEQVAEIEF